MAVEKNWKIMRRDFRRACRFIRNSCADKIGSCISGRPSRDSFIAAKAEILGFLQDDIAVIDDMTFEEFTTRKASDYHA